MTAPAHLQTAPAHPSSTYWSCIRPCLNVFSHVSRMSYVTNWPSLRRSVGLSFNVMVWCFNKTTAPESYLHQSHPAFTRSFIHLFIHWSVYLSVYSYIYSFIYQFVLSLIHSFFHSYIHLSHLFVGSNFVPASSCLSIYSIFRTGCFKWVVT